MAYLLISIFVFFLIKTSTNLFIQNKWLDNSDNRKIHSGSIPLNGGLAMFFGFFLGVVFLNNNIDSYTVLLTCSFLILILGFIDDISNLSAHSRILAQTFIILIAFSVGLIQIKSLGYIFGSNIIDFNEWALPITLLAFMAGINAQNFIDGIDGLSSGTAIISFVAIYYLAQHANFGQISGVALLYISILIPFMYLNMSKNKIFMGDSGALFIGFGLSWLLIYSTQGEIAFIKPVTALWILAIPLIDISSVIVIRVLSGQSPFKPDHNHIHNQIINRLKVKSRHALIILLSFSALLACSGVILQLLNISDWIMFTALMIIFILYLTLIFNWKNWSFKVN
jgi:UDP-GlcNAc:undecaprenyl-phosphate/decaprenyl-phosphate GlcNAc-1-phosphate transferase